MKYDCTHTVLVLVLPSSNVVHVPDTCTKDLHVCMMYMYTYVHTLHVLRIRLTLHILCTGALTDLRAVKK